MFYFISVALICEGFPVDQGPLHIVVSLLVAFDTQYFCSLLKSLVTFQWVCKI